MTLMRRVGLEEGFMMTKEGIVKQVVHISQLFDNNFKVGKSYELGDPGDRTNEMCFAIGLQIIIPLLLFNIPKVIDANIIKIIIVTIRAIIVIPCLFLIIFSIYISFSVVIVFIKACRQQFIISI